MLRAVASFLSRTRPKVTVIKRNVSEYAKRYGYTPDEMYPEAKILWPEVITYLSLSAGMIYIMVRDQRKHLAVLMENFDENKKYYKYPRAPISSGDKPSMDFLMDELYPLYPATGDEDKNFQHFIVKQPLGLEMMAEGPDTPNPFPDPLPYSSLPR